MQKAGGMRRWTALRRTLSIPDNLPAPPLAKPTDATLDRFEAETGFRLPHSYRSFIKVFGPGTLAWDYRIKAPGYPEQGEDVDLGTFNARIKQTLTKKQAWQQLADPTQARRVVFFCALGGGDLVGWDPEDIRDRRRREYGIYSWGRKVALEFVAGSFTEFIADVCFSEANLRIPPGYKEEELGTRREFIPAVDLAAMNPTPRQSIGRGRGKG
jgi:hypothetical protein